MHVLLLSWCPVLLEPRGVGQEGTGTMLGAECLQELQWLLLLFTMICFECFVLFLLGGAALAPAAVQV